MIVRLAAFVAVFIVVTVPALADPVGRYTVEGKNPGGGPSYSGTVSVERTGQTYRVVWDVGGSRFIGTGVGNKDFLAVSYRLAAVPVWRFMARRMEAGSASGPTPTARIWGPSVGRGGS